MSDVRYDETGRVILDGIYDQPDPVSYFATLARLDYQIPRHAAPVLRRLVEALRRTRGRRALTIVDLGAAYGINAAMLKHGREVDELFGRYAEGEDRAALLTRDRRDHANPAEPELRIIGIDRAGHALGYATESGLLDAGIEVDLEQRDLDEDEVALLGDADLIISTGTTGYVTAMALERLLAAARPRQPWMAHFVLRTADFDGPRSVLDEQGYVTETAPDLYPVRRFASEAERIRVFDSLAQLGIDPEGAEGEGMYFARLHVARPAGEEAALPLAEVLQGIELPAG